MKGHLMYSILIVISKVYGKDLLSGLSPLHTLLFNLTLWAERVLN